MSRALPVIFLMFAAITTSADFKTQEIKTQQVPPAATQPQPANTSALVGAPAATGPVQPPQPVIVPIPRQGEQKKDGQQNPAKDMINQMMQSMGPSMGGMTPSPAPPANTDWSKYSYPDNYVFNYGGR